MKLTRGEFLLGILTSACASTLQGAPARRVTFNIDVPPDVPTVYLSGSLKSLGPWNPAAKPTGGQGRRRSVTLLVPEGETFEYKFTLGTWDREALSSNGLVAPHGTLTVGASDIVRNISIPGFKLDPLVYIADWRSSGVIGRLDYWLKVTAPGLPLPRHVSVWTPPGYEAGTERYPVVYMHDGQNLFDPRLASMGVDWGADEAMMKLAKVNGERVPAIIVGIWNTAHRWNEYAPKSVVEALPAGVLCGTPWGELTPKDVVRRLPQLRCRRG